MAVVVPVDVTELVALMEDEPEMDAVTVTGGETVACVDGDTAAVLTADAVVVVDALDKVDREGGAVSVTVVVTVVDAACTLVFVAFPTDAVPSADAIGDPVPVVVSEPEIDTFDDALAPGVVDVDNTGVSVTADDLEEEGVAL